MLICPECQTENVENNKFCDQCGTSLTHQNCPSCGVKVSYSDINCPNCGVVTTKYYDCIMGTEKNTSLQIIFPSLNNLTADSETRYVLTKSLSLEEISPFEETDTYKLYHLSIMDVKPLQKSSLDTILEVVEGFDRQTLVKAGIPSLAFPYLTLAEYCPIVPELFDAWQDHTTNQEVVIIPRRHNWQSILEYWQTNQPSTRQIFAHLQKLAKLWKSFLKVKCCQTLLDLNNIGVGEDGNLQLHKLYLDSTNYEPQLDQLLETWIRLLEQTERQELPLVTQLLIEIEQGAINDIKKLRSRLDKLSKEAELDKLIQGESSNEEELLLIPADEELDEIADQFDFDEEEISDQEATVINEENNDEVDDQPTVVLPMRLLSVSEAGFTDIGRKRGHNEDCFAIETNITKKETPQGSFCTAKGFFVVCDGMGGHAAGEVASAMAVKELHRYFEEHWQDEFPDEDTIKEGILQANKAIYNANMDKGNVGSGRMGTTLVMTLVEGTKVAIAHVGDSRIYRVTRKWGLEQLSTDHSVAQVEIQNGVDAEIAFARPDAFQLTQALGPRDNNFVHPDIDFLDVKEDTLIVMCSDGVSDNQLIENNWQSHFLPLISSKSNLEEGLLQIIDLGNQVNGHDNLTCILVRIKVQPNLENQHPLF